MIERAARLRVAVSCQASSAVVVPFREESVAESFGSVALGFGAGLGVDAECEPRVGVTEPGLGGLEVDAFEDESGGVGAAEVVELDPLDAGLLSRIVGGARRGPYASTSPNNRSAFEHRVGYGAGARRSGCLQSSRWLTGGLFSPAIRSRWP